MKGLVIGSDKSGGGKTTLTMAMMKALCNRGYRIQGYKVGPDYIDPGFHSFICQIDSRNLDTHLMGEEGVKASFSRGKGDIAIVEGAMGFYDGIGLGTKCSTADIARIIGLPVVLVLSPKAQMATLFAQINGILSYKKNNIVGVILNNISESYYEKLRIGIETKCNLKVFGYLPRDSKFEIPSRSLGLIQPLEIKDLEKRIDYLAMQIEKNVDIASLITCMGQAPVFQDTFQVKKRNIKIAVARDQAFNFYYKENLELLEQAGQVIYFSPLKDRKLPQDLDFLYIGGGHLEEFAKDLSGNSCLLKDIRQRLNKGLRCYAESGGLLYLTSGSEEYPMVGFFEGSYWPTKSLQNFGYASLTVCKENPLLPIGLKINCQQFHRSRVNLKEAMIYCMKKNQYFANEKSWTCGYQKKNTIGSYAYTHFFGNMKMLKGLVAF